MICRFAALKRKIQVSQVAEFFSTQSFHKRTEEHRGTLFLYIRWRWSEEPKGSYAERLRDLLRRMAL